MNPAEGIPIPQTADPKKLDPKVLVEQIHEERRTAERRVAEERQRGRMELDRLRGATSQHIRDLEDQNKALLRSLSRLQLENDRLNEELVTLRVKLENNGVREEPQAAPPQPVRPASIVPMPDPIRLGPTLSIVPPAAPTLGGEPVPPANIPPDRRS